MASLQQIPSGTFYILFRFGGTKYKRSLRTKQRRQALALKARLEDTIQLINAGRVELPESADIPTFLLSDGKLASKLVVRETRLRELFDRYFDSMPEGNLEPGTVYMMKIHSRTLERILGKQFSLKLLSFNGLQRYVNKRSEEKGTRGKPLNASTIQKELATLRGLWKWAATSGEIPNRDFPSTGLRYPKVTELPPFQPCSQSQHSTLLSASSRLARVVRRQIASVQLICVTLE